MNVTTSSLKQNEKYSRSGRIKDLNNALCGVEWCLFRCCPIIVLLCLIVFCYFSSSYPVYNINNNINNLVCNFATPPALELVIICVGIYANPPPAFTDIYAILNFICVFAYIYCVYVSLYAKKNLPSWALKKSKCR